MTRFKPTKQQMIMWIQRNEMSLTKISGICGYSVPSLSKLCLEYEINVPSVGRPRGYKASKEERNKISNSIKRIHQEETV